MFFVRFFLSGLLLSVVISAKAQLLEKPQADAIDSTVSAEIENTILQRLRSARPDLNFTDVESSPVTGLYKIKINGQVSFVSRSGEFIIAGEMYQLQGRQLVNLQQVEREQASVAFEPERAKLMDAVNKEDMVIYSPEGEVKTYVTIFTDIDCGFCRRLHSQMDEFMDEGIEIRYLAFPRAGADSHSAQKLATVWCSEEATLMMDQFKQGMNVALAPCDTSPVSEQYLLGQRVGVTGTPSIILPSGKLVPGAVSTEYLLELLGI